MHLVVLKVVDKKVKDHLLRERVTTLLLVVKIILLVGIYLLVDSKIKKIVQTILMLQDVNLNKKVKDHLLREKVTTLLLEVVEMNRLKVEMNRLQEVKNRQLEEKNSQHRRRLSTELDRLLKALLPEGLAIDVLLRWDDRAFYETLVVLPLSLIHI